MLEKYSLAQKKTGIIIFGILVIALASLNRLFLQNIIMSLIIVVLVIVFFLVLVWFSIHSRIITLKRPQKQKMMLKRIEVYQSGSRLSLITD